VFFIFTEPQGKIIIRKEIKVKSIDDDAWGRFKIFNFSAISVDKAVEKQAISY